MRLLMQMRKKDRNSRKIFRRKNGIGEGEKNLNYKEILQNEEVKAYLEEGQRKSRNSWVYRSFRKTLCNSCKTCRDDFVKIWIYRT